jgi:hypothetical protein
MSDGRYWTAALLAVTMSLGCAPIVDEVFVSLTLEPTPPQIIPEGLGSVEIPLRLSDTPSQPITLAYRVVGIEAQNDCPEPDFEAAEGRVEWLAGVRDGSLRVWVGDDFLAETDERFQIVFEPLAGLPASAVSPIEITIADDDRTGLVRAEDHGVTPGVAADQALQITGAMAAAAALGRGVLVMSPGDYEVSSVIMPAGTTLSARGVRWNRPAMSAADTVTLRIDQVGAADSARTLVEGLTIDGRRDIQGAYRDHERENAHLVALEGDSDQGGRVLGSLEGMLLVSGTGSGTWVGADADVSVCNLEASELWRDAVTVVGGNTVARLRNIDATATEGTGLWVGARNQGFMENLTLDVEADNVRVSAGDVEIETAGESRVTLRRLVMTQSPFRLDAPGGTVRISDSVLMVGLPSEAHNYVGRPHDVQISATTIVAAEASADGALDEQARSFAAFSLRSETQAQGTPADGPGSLSFDGCRFEIGRDVEADDTVFGFESSSGDASIVVRNGQLGPGFAGWFAPSCTSCLVEP